MKKLILSGLSAACLILSLPLSATAATDPALSLSPTPGAAPGYSLTLKVKCQKACSLKLRELTVLRFDRAGSQAEGSDTAPLRMKRQLPRGGSTAMVLPLSGSAGTLARRLINAGEYARVGVTAQYRSGSKAHEVQPSIALHRPGRPKLTYADSDAAVTAPPAPKKAKVNRYRVTVSALQKTEWRYNRDAEKASDCTVVANGQGTQILRFKSTGTTIAKLARRADGRPYFDARPLPIPQLFVKGKLSVDRKGVVNAGLRGPCEGEYGGNDDPRPASDCFGKVDFKASVLLEYQPDGRLSAYRLPSDELGGYDRGLTCPVEFGSQRLSPLEIRWAFGKRADPVKHGGDPGKYIVILRNKDTDPLVGGTSVTTTRYTVTFLKK